MSESKIAISSKEFRTRLNSRALRIPPICYQIFEPERIRKSSLILPHCCKPNDGLSLRTDGLPVFTIGRHPHEANVLFFALFMMTTNVANRNSPSEPDFCALFVYILLLIAMKLIATNLTVAPSCRSDYRLVVFNAICVEKNLPSTPWYWLL